MPNAKAGDIHPPSSSPGGVASAVASSSALDEVRATRMPPPRGPLPCPGVASSPATSPEARAVRSRAELPKLRHAEIPITAMQIRMITYSVVESPR